MTSNIRSNNVAKREVEKAAEAGDVRALVALKVLVVTTDEERMIARETIRSISRST